MITNIRPEFNSSVSGSGRRGIRAGKILAPAAIILALLILFSSCVCVISGGHTGVVSTFGKISDVVLQEGFHFKAPWQKVTVMDNRIVKLDVSTQAFSSDLQTVDVALAINYRIDPNMSYYIIKNIGSGYEDILVTPAANEVLKSIVAQYTAEQSITNRVRISTDLLDGLNTRLNSSGIYVKEINIIDFDFSDTYIAAVEAKQVAEQEMLKAQIEQQQKTMETQAAADRAVIDAKAALEVTKIESEAAEYAGQKEASKNQAIANTLTEELIRYYTILAWNGKLPAITGSDTIITGMLGEDLLG